MEHLIRPMTEKDLPLVAEIERHCFSMPWSEEELEKCRGLENYRFFVSEADGRPVGYAGILCCMDEADVTTIAVEEDYRRQGIGRALLDAMLDYAEELKIRSVFLEVRAGNEPAKRLYESVGFKTVGRRKDYYEQPTEDALLMKYERRTVC